MAEPKATQKSPYVLELPPKEYWWCACGLSEKQPFCDGSHDFENTGIKPVQLIIEKRQEVALCGCRQTKTPPFCDGSHKNL
jgi:CDGSH-type Zn-finger protein